MTTYPRMPKAIWGYGFRPFFLGAGALAALTHSLVGRVTGVGDAAGDGLAAEPVWQVLYLEPSICTRSPSGRPPP